MTNSAAIYLRKSTSTSTKQKNSLKVQLEVIENFTNLHGYSVVAEFSDSKSGTTNDRPGLQSALTWLREDKTRTLIVYRVDRIARNLSVWSDLEPLLPQLRFVEFGDEPVNMMVLSVMLSMAAQESRNISARVKAAYKFIKSENPDHVWGCKEALVEGRKRSAEVRTDNANTYGFKMLEINNMLEASGISSLAEKVEWLNAHDYKARRGGKLTAPGLYRTIKRAKARMAS
tara:strand:- start:1335 stop:2024 length:690 start_codon:yes stop_codon:yes gene_type:complete